MKLKPLFAATLLLAAPLWTAGCGNSQSDQVFFSSRSEVVESKRGFSNDPGRLPPLNPNISVDPPGGKVLAIYMVGSDLETNHDAATIDLDELATGLEQYSEEQLSDFNLLIAFGGSAKKNWQGMKWMNLEQFARDSEDEIIGNETGPDAYLYRADEANMGDKSSLSLFLRHLKDTYPNEDQRVVVLWDHGASYGGYGVDENFNDDRLTLGEIRESFLESGGSQFDLLGFDACLMASMETVRYVQDAARLMVASEELEPGHGWDYRYVGGELVTQSSIDVYARGLVDNFVDSANHPYEDSGKTLSVLNLAGTEQALAALESYATQFNQLLSTELEACRALIYANSETQAFSAYGIFVRDSIDLQDFVRLVSERTDALRTEAGALEQALDSLVVYSAQDGSRPNAQGISIVPPDENASQVEEGDFAVPGWETLYLGAQRKLDPDRQAPLLLRESDVPEGLEVAYSDESLYTVRTLWGILLPDGRVEQVADLTSLPTNDTATRIAQAWDGRWLTVTFDGNSPPVVVPLTYISSGRFEGREVDNYLLPILFERDGQSEPGRLSVTLDRNGNVATYSVKTVQSLFNSAGDDTPTDLVDRETVRFRPNDRVRFLRRVYTLDENRTATFQFVPGEPLVFTQAPVFNFGAVGGEQLVFGALASDAKGQSGLSNLRPARR